MEGGFGGDDVLFGGDNSTNHLYGDADELAIGVGGDDTLIGGKNSTNYLYGDAFSMTVRPTAGGNDTLIGGDNSTNYLYGDASFWFASTGGNDRLISGTGSDHMWGDAAAMMIPQGGYDTFVFKAHNGPDTIYDFEQGKDVIDLSALDLYLRKGKVPPLTGWDALDSNRNDILDDGDKYVRVANGNTVIDLGAAQRGASHVDFVTVAGVTALAEGDFIF